MNSRTRPKQFLELHSKPILIYTLEAFEKCGEIDGIIVVMLESWIDYTKQLVKKYQISKVAAVVPGGKTGQESIFLGVSEALKVFGKECNVLIHDGVRPIIDSETIIACIHSVEKYGSAITTVSAQETVAIVGENEMLGSILPRSQCLIAKAPQCFRLEDIYNCHLKANEEGEQSFIDSASLMQHYGFQLHAVTGSIENMKITTPADFYIFRAILDAQENSQIFG